MTEAINNVLKLGSIYNVLSYGVTGDGSDEVSKMHTAIADTPTGGTLLIPAGLNIRIASQLTISKSITILGYGATITELSGFGSTSLIRATAANVTIEGLTVVGLSTGKSGINSPGTNLGGFTVRYCDVSGCGYGILGNNNSRVLIERNYVHDNSIYGIWCQNTLDAGVLDDIQVLHNRVDTSHLDPLTSVSVCILVRGTSTYLNTNVKIKGNTMIMPYNPTNSGALGCEFRYNDGVVFSGNYALHGAMIVSSALSLNVTIANNKGIGQAFYAIEVASLAGFPCNETSVIGNTINGLGILRYAIGLQGEEENGKCTVVGNTITNTLQYGVFVNHTWRSVVISDNTIHIFGVGSSYGVYSLGNTSAITDMVISGNIFRGDGIGRKAIYLYDTSNVTVVGNSISGWTENGVLIHSASGTVDRIAINGNSFVDTTGRVATFGAGSFGNNIVVTGNAGFAVSNTIGSNILNFATTLIEAWGTGSPESLVTASVGSTFRRTNGGAGTSFYVKETGTGNTGWVGK